MYADDEFELGVLGEHEVSDGLAPARDAATIVIVSFGTVSSDHVRGYEVLVLQRSSDLVFAPGAWVFPGGAAAHDDTLMVSENRVAMRQTACRECAEETGIELGTHELLPLSRWITPPGRPRRFDTRFYVAIIDYRPVVRVDGLEIVDFSWSSPDTALAQYGEAMLPPTRATLSALPDAGTPHELRNWITEQVR
jgi:8-oxo-dGTP pyrophosphatase MutT (NUDIX family)